MDTDSGGASRLLNKNVISNETNISDDAVHHQCRTARVTSFKDTLVSVSQDETFGKTISIQTPLVGSLGDHPNAGGTFHGSRVMKGNACVNQSISASFDPAKLTCISCKKEHSIDGKNPGIFFFTDQNFVPAISNNNEMCVNIVRIENASLLELFEIAVEIFGNTVFPEGSIFLFGTASYLGRVGTSLYASDWCQVVALSLERWRGIRVCPLIPLILAECTGNIVREISEIALWFESVYDTNPQGLHDTRMCLVTAMEAHSTGATSLDVLESYKTPVPSSLSSGTLDKVMTFCSNN
jgi:hypothetical protein